MPAPPHSPGGSPPPEGASGGRWVPGARIGPWVLEEELGRGGMGAVFRARGPDGAAVALKLLLQRAANPAAAARFEREAGALRGLRHPHLVGLIEASPGPPPWIAMELVEGSSLEALLRGGPLAPARAARIVGEAALGLAQAHARGVVHRDVKPANLLLRASDGSAVVSDFGLVRALDQERLTRTGALVGTPAYMSPEQALGAGDVGPPADVWALGVTLYRCLTGQEPFQGEALLELVATIQAAAPPRPSGLQPGIPPDLEAICLACLQADPARRPEAAALARALLTRRPARRSSPLLLLAAALVGAALLAAAIPLLRAPLPGPGALSSSAPDARALPPPGPEWRRVWGLGDAPIPTALGDVAATTWSPPGRRVDPLEPVRHAPPDTPVGGFMGQASSLGQGRVAVEYALGAAVSVELQRPGSTLLQGPAGAGRPTPDPDRAGAVRVLAPNDAGQALVRIGRASWESPVVEVTWRRVEPVDSDVLVFLSREGYGGPLGMDGRAGILYSKTARLPWTPGPDWHRLRIAPEAPPGERLSLDGRALPTLEGEPDRDPRTIELLLGEVHLGLASVRIEGRPLRTDAPSLCHVDLELPASARLAAGWARHSPQVSGGPVVGFTDGARPTRCVLALELDQRTLRLWTSNQRAGEATLPPDAPVPASGVLVLARRDDLVRGELWLPGAAGATLTVEACDPTPSLARTFRPVWGSSGPALEFPAVEAQAGPVDPEREAWDQAGPQGELPPTPAARWRTAALQLEGLLDPLRCPKPLIGAPPARKELARQLADALEAAADELASPLLQADALARALQARVLGAEPARAADTARRAVSALGPARAVALLSALERVPDTDGLVARLRDGYGNPRHPLIQTSGLRVLEQLCPDRQAEVAHGLATAERNLGLATRGRAEGDPEQREAQARTCLERALTQLDRAASLGFPQEKVDELRAEVLLDLDRAGDALPLWERRARDPEARRFFYTWLRLAECLERLPDRREQALEARLAVLALRPGDGAGAQRLLTQARALADGGGSSQRATALAAQKALAIAVGRVDLLREAVELARSELANSQGRAQDLLLWVLLPPSGPSPPPPPGARPERPSAVFLAAAAADPAARERLAAAAEEDAFLRHLALLDPTLAPFVNR